jgi:AhpC/TSA family
VVVGLLFAVLVVIALVNTRGGGDGILGLDRYPHLWPLPEFAVPVAESELEGDANVAQDDCETSQVPCPPEARRVPACRVPGADVIRVCDFFDRPLVLSFWFSQGGNCVEQQDAVDAVYRRYRERVGFLSLNVRDDRDTVRDLIRERGWEMPVGYDQDGAVASLYRVGGCPTFAYVYPGGVLQGASVDLSAAQLGARVRELLAATRAAERS